jgi:hypothetical protein
LTTKSIGEVEFLTTKSKYIIRYTFPCKWISLGYFYIFFHTPKFGLEFFDEVNSPNSRCGRVGPRPLATSTCLLCPFSSPFCTNFAIIPAYK